MSPQVTTLPSAFAAAKALSLPTRNTTSAAKLAATEEESPPLPVLPHVVTLPSVPNEAKALVLITTFEPPGRRLVVVMVVDVTVLLVDVVELDVDVEDVLDEDVDVDDVDVELLLVEVLVVEVLVLLVDVVELDVDVEEVAVLVGTRPSGTEPPRFPQAARVPSDFRAAKNSPSRGGIAMVVTPEVTSVAEFGC